MYLKDDGDESVEHDQHCEDPKVDEKEPDHVAVPLDSHEHVHSDEPVVDDHLVEQSDQGAAIVVEVHQVVKDWGATLLVTLKCQVSTEKEAAQRREEVEEQVDQEKLAEYGLRNVPHCFAYDLHALIFGEEVEDSHVSKDDDERKNLVSFVMISVIFCDSEQQVY